MKGLLCGGIVGAVHFIAFAPQMAVLSQHSRFCICIAINSNSSSEFEKICGNKYFQIKFHLQFLLSINQANLMSAFDMLGNN